MSYLFDDLKSFMVAHSFFKKFASCSSTLLKLMQDTISNPCEHSYGIFKNECERTPPLRFAMLFLETYLNGMFWNSNMYGPNSLKERIQKLNKEMNQWYEDYHDQNKGWDGVKQLVEEIQDNNTHIGNHEKADLLQRRIDEILSNHDSYESFINSLGEEIDRKCACSFVGMIRANNNVAVRWVNCDPSDVPNGPGAFTHVDTQTRHMQTGMLGHRTIRGDRFFVIVGIK
ncbi:hypothetical protein CAEBREN_29905 [Caenorhabditis brenneri]|uniref:Uncharacterized protein n=1 Tax=Caenorhabditis brenneri TaxID=135651 RepID=G0M921_CAEBE|nr:hypothetical protein CAEBREN_29905 [Caenorhabditis brenneri]